MKYLFGHLPINYFSYYFAEIGEKLRAGREVTNFSDSTILTCFNNIYYHLKDWTKAFVFYIIV